MFILLPALFFGFWLPPLIAGVWMAGRRQRLLNIPLVAVVWSPVWFVANLLMLQSVPKGRSPDGQGYMVLGLMVWAFFIVPPGSAMACWIGTRWHSWRFSLRALLITTTLVAVVLGLIVWASR
jgi:hypothetical protein